MKKIAIYGQVYKESHKESLQILLRELKEYNIKVAINEMYYKEIVLKGYDVDDIESYCLENGLSTSFDTMITLGGDGTILRAFERSKQMNIPILGINLGRLGFLATLQKGGIKKAIEKIINNDFSIQKRTMLEIKTVTNGKEETIGHALNDVTIAKKDTNSMIGVESFLNNSHLTTYWADGLIIATPTGSTGYSLSCQGPVVMPNTNNLVITPVAPHNLNARPIIISDDTHISLKVLSREDQFLVSLDSKVHTIDVDTEIIVSKSNYAAQLIELKENIFIDTLRDKLLWGYDKRNHSLQ